MKRILWISAIAVTILALSLDAFAQPGQGGQRQGGQGQGRQAGGAAQGGGQGQGRQAGGAAQGGAQGQGRQAGAFQAGAGQFGGGLGNLATFTRNTEVVKAVNITTEQATALAALFPQGQGQAQQQGQQLTPAERAAQQRTQTAERWAGIDKTLNAEQQKKFKELYFQVNVPILNPNAPAVAPVPTMNLNAYVLGAVDLTADQKEKITKIANDLADANQAAGGFGVPGGQQMTQEERAAARTAATERTTKANDAILALLTDAQKKKMDELKAGAAAVQTTLRAGQPVPAGRGPGGAAPAGPNATSWQPGQATPDTQRAATGTFPRGAATN